MRVLVVHNRYGGGMPSGENTVVDAEVALLRDGGVDVHTFFRSSDDVHSMDRRERVSVALGTISGRTSRDEFADALRRLQPDVVHLHNPYPLITPSVVGQASAAGVPVVATVHNHRLTCIGGWQFRDGQVCTDCATSSWSLPGVRHGCYRGSHAQSVVMAVARRAHRPRWNDVRTFIAISEFMAERLRAEGVEPHRIVVKPNATPDPGTVTAGGHGFLYAGRFVEEKGVGLLLEAWGRSGLAAGSRLVLAGDGPLTPLVRDRAAADPAIEWVGLVTAGEVAGLRAATAACVIPSLGWEPQSSAPESFAAGRPVIATRRGALGSLVDDEVGWSTTADAAALAAALLAAADPTEAARRGSAARARYDAQHSPAVVLQQLLGIYASTVG